MGSHSDTKRLTETDYSHQLADYASKRHPGTLNWLLESAEYRTWLESSPQTLFCFGEPGTGKSVAASFLVQDLTQRLRGDEPDGVSIERKGQQTVANVACIFFDSLRHAEQRYKNIALCITEQLASRQLPSKKPEDPPWRDESNWRLHDSPPEVSISRYLKEQIAGHATHSTVFLILDALDECPETSRTALLALLAEVQREHLPLNVLVTSRNLWAPAPAIQGQFENTASLEINARQQDLEIYMADRLPSDIWSRKDVLSKTVRAADGRFLLAKIYLELLVSMPSPETLNFIAPEPTGPDGYDDLYSSVMDKIALQPPHRAHLAERCLPWLTFAKRPLSIPELQEALAIPTDRSAGLSFEDSPAGIASVVSSCGGLARLDCINGISCIRLYDRTTRDYLRRRLSSAEADVGRICVVYLLSRSDSGACKTDEDLIERLRLNPLYDYAAHHWGQHIQNISTPPLSDTVIQDFLGDRTRWEGALQVEHTVAQMRLRGFKQPCNYISQNYPKRTEKIHLAARAGAANLIAALLAQNNGSAIINVRDNDGRTALSYTAQAGNDDILEVLLADSSLDVDARDCEGRTPISHAAENGHASVVCRLLERGAKPSWKDLNRASPLWYAAQYGHVAVVRVLLDCGHLSDLNPRPRYSRNTLTDNTPLSCALKNGFNEISEMLARADGIDAHAEVRFSDGTTTVLELAIRNRYEAIALRLLHKYGIGQSSDYRKPGGELLVVAAGIGSTRLVESLVAMHGVDPNTTYPDNREHEFQGLSPLMAAAKKGHGDVVALLLDTEAIRPDANHHDGTALSLAAKNGFRDIVDMLVAEKSVEVDRKDAKGRTPLSFAAEGAHEDVVEALLMNETVNPDCRDNQGRTPLSRATGRSYARNYNGVVRRLLADARVDPNSRDMKGHTPLYYAAKMGDASLVKQILDHPGIDLGFGDKRAPLVVAASEGHVGAAKAFLQMGCFDVNAPMAYSDEGLERTLLSLAAGSGHIDMVELLLSQPGIEPHKRDSQGWTPLAMAALKGHAAIVERLLTVEGADPNSRDIRGWTPLRMVATAKYSSIGTVRALLRAKNINPDTPDLEERTPLSVACEYFKLELVDLLLASDGVDPDSRDNAGRSPLSWAVDPSYYAERNIYFDSSIDWQKKVMRRLLRIQAVDPNAEDVEGLTPLIRAIQGQDGNELVQVLVERKDLDVCRRSRDGRTPIAFARKMGDSAVTSLLRERAALNEGSGLSAAVGDPQHSSSDDNPNVGNLRLPRRGEESADLQAGLQRRRSSSSSASSLSSTKHDLQYQLVRKILLPLGAQQEHVDLVGSNDADLCARCNTIDLDEAFSMRKAASGVYLIAELGRIDAIWKAGECPMCRLIASVSPRRAEGDIEEEDHELDLVAFSSTGVWLCNNQLDSWQHFPARWIDTLWLGVVPRWMRVGRNVGSAAHSLLKSGCIGRLGSNCEHGTRAITISRVGDGADLAAAKRWIECCREEHSRRCNPRTLARVPHFRLINCGTRRIVQQGDQVPSYVALSYVWGPPPAAGLGEKRKLKFGDSGLPRDGLDIGECVEAVVEDAIRVTLGLGCEFLWVDRYCVLQEGDGKVKEEQLQNMDLVYANAEVTLVAAAGQASSGLPGVNSRCPRVSQPAVRIKGHALTLIPPDPACQVRSSAWMTRGWTYQEGLLSRRRLFFSESEMSFECRGLLAREAIRLPPSVKKQMRHPDVSLMNPSWIYRGSGIVSLDDSGLDLISQVAQYTRRKLTYQSDVLNAMLGIFRIYANLERSPIYHVCGVPILPRSGSRLPGTQNVAASNDGGSDNAGVALAGFVSGLCWTLYSMGVRRPGFPSWSWTGWHGVVDSFLLEPVRVEFRDGFEVQVSIVLTGGITTMPWSDYYGQMRDAVVKEGRYGSVFSQHHMLDITASVIVAQFYERQEFSIKWKGAVCIGDEVWMGDFALTKKDSLRSSGDNEVGFVPSLRRRLLEESWLGIVLGQSSHGSYKSDEVYVLIIEEMRPSAIGAIAHWERVGLLTIKDSTLKSEMLERRKLRLA